MTVGDALRFRWRRAVRDQFFLRLVPSSFAAAFQVQIQDEAGLVLFLLPLWLAPALAVPLDLGAKYLAACASLRIPTQGP
jgi:hypothetical protein